MFSKTTVEKWFVKFVEFVVPYGLLFLFFGGAVWGLFWAGRGFCDDLFNDGAKSHGYFAIGSLGIVAMIGTMFLIIHVFGRE